MLKHINNKNKLIITIIGLFIVFFLVFRGRILGFCIEKINYCRNYKDSTLITGNLKKNFIYTSNEDIGGLVLGNYDVKETSTGIIYTIVIEDLGSDLSGNNKNVLINYNENNIPKGILK